ncbi:DUF3788 family protein [Rhodohalobacter sp. 614A]|uniref:DUF3788 family protein n=1 Tax=Rhodohalobacter sp. 614A TaxID=2908649 RepID=UPI001F1C459C|nr:DUF3788 family protein [Rhodohalobacter sp. 614A]
MTESAFHEKNITPDEVQIREKLKQAYTPLLELRETVKKIAGETVEEWKFYGPKNGWILKTFLKKRNLFFIIIYDGFFRASFVFGEKTVSKILESDISENLKKELSKARKYAEGRGVSMIVKDNSFIVDFQKLLKFKIEK